MQIQEFIVALSGSFDLVIDDSKIKQIFSLNRSYYGLYVPQGIWAAEQSFTSGSICLGLASELFEESDYIRNYEILRNLKKAKHSELQ